MFREEEPDVAPADRVPEPRDPLRDVLVPDADALGRDTWIAPAERAASSRQLHRDGIYRRRVIALAALAALLIAGITVPLVLLSGGGGQQGSAGAAPPTTLPSQPATSTTSTESTAPSSPATAATPLTVALPGGKALRLGDSGAAVKQLQKALAALGLDPGTPDGDFGSNTQAAVVEFQKSNGLGPDGVVGAKTVATLNTLLAEL